MKGHFKETKNQDLIDRIKKYPVFYDIGDIGVYIAFEDIAKAIAATPPTNNATIYNCAFDLIILTTIGNLINRVNMDWGSISELVSYQVDGKEIGDIPCVFSLDDVGKDGEADDCYLF